jgi:hypothetical protein
LALRTHGSAEGLAPPFHHLGSQQDAADGRDSRTREAEETDIEDAGPGGGLLVPGGLGASASADSWIRA